MPLYEYQCDACGHRFERIQKFSDPIADTCPVCGGAVRKLVSSPAIQFKGSGFYITDYPKKDQGGTDKTDGGSSEKTAKSESTSSKDDKASKGDKGEKSAAPAASDKGASTSSASSASGSKDSAPASSSTPKSNT